MRKPLLAGTATMSLALAAALAATPTLASSAQAAVITFETAPIGDFTGPVTENGFTYSRLSGALYVDTAGNPGKDMEGQSGASNGGGGVLDITAASGGPAAFTYSGLDYAAFDTRGTGSQTLTVAGLLGGSTVGTDTYTLANTNVSIPTYPNWTSELASNLSGKTIDDLRIALNGSNCSDAQ